MSAPLLPPHNGRTAATGVLALTVVVFALVVAVVTQQLRVGLREQLLQRQAETLGAVASMQLDNSASNLGDTPLELVPTVLLNAVLKTSKFFSGVVGVRVFDAAGQYNGAWPFAWSREAPAAEVWAKLKVGRSLAQLHHDLVLEDLIGVPLPTGAAPETALEVWVPLRQSGSVKLIGVAQFWVQGADWVADTSAHDRRLWVQAAIAWFVGSIVIVLGMSWAFRRLAVVNRELRVRGEDLQRANRELVLAAKTSALGAVTAHLMHELKNPIAGLELFMSGQTEAGAAGGRPVAGDELAAASELTHRLRTMVNDVVEVLRDEQTGAQFEFNGAEIAEVAVAKVQSDATKRGVRLVVEAAGDRPISGRRANLAILILRNLLQNALEATPGGGTVRLTGQVSVDGTLEFHVQDGGTGLPQSVRERLFQPCISTKAGGSGLGLALSHQLAQQARGRLELVQSDAGGTSFRLVLAAEA